MFNDVKINVFVSDNRSKNAHVNRCYLKYQTCEKKNTFIPNIILFVHWIVIHRSISGIV